MSMGKKFSESCFDERSETKVLFSSGQNVVGVVSLQEQSLCGNSIVFFPNKFHWTMGIQIKISYKK